MNCCTGGDPSERATPAPTAIPRAWPRRAATLIQWALPLTTRVLVPKCPACVAAYALFFTGLSLSLPAAAAVRWTLITLSFAVLAYLLFRAARRAVPPRRTGGETS